VEQDLGKLAGTVSSAESLEALTRPLLELLEKITGLPSTYLTTTDELAGVQTILFARNTTTLQIPEGMMVPWRDTLCKRALEEDRRYTDDVPGHWGESEAARKLGIRTYVSEPVRTLDGEVWGTLCGVSADAVPIDENALSVLTLFARLVAYQVERERALETLRAQNALLEEQAMIDPLTRLPNRRAAVPEIERMLARAKRDGKALNVAYIDLDNFKKINDSWGHDAGDRFLLMFAKRLREGLRTGDLVARLGGDEFLVVVAADSAVSGLFWKLSNLTQGRFDIGPKVIDYKGPSIGIITSMAADSDADDLIARADSAMYSVKKARKAADFMP
jgi:diguanylate cyclase